MGIKMYADNISIVTKDNNLFITKEEIDEEQLNTIHQLINEDKIRRIEANNVNDSKSISVFISKEKYHLGIVDMYNDINYYLDNMSGDTSLIEIDGNYFEERFVSENRNVVWEILECFIRTGNISNKYNFYSE